MSRVSKDANENREVKDSFDLETKTINEIISKARQENINPDELFKMMDYNFDGKICK